MKIWLRLLVVCFLLLMTTAMTYARRDEEADKAQATAAAETTTLKCPKCQNGMEDGFLLDQQGYNSQYTNTQWVEGPVKKKFLGGIETKVRRPILAFRCTSCGYLELYAK
jgi:predicted nucleic-acid-binding Zn-ribbon protein